MKLYCPECGRPIRDEDIDPQSAWAHCRDCPVTFNFHQRTAAGRPLPPDRTQTLPPLQPTQGDVVGRQEEIVPRPSRMRVDRSGGLLRIHWRWFGWQYVPLAFFCLFWDGFLLFWYSMAFSGRAPLVMCLFPLLHVGVGVVLTYTVIAGFFNQTTILVGRDGVMIQHGPLPWPGNRRLPKAQITQLFCERRTTRHRRRHHGYSVSEHYQLSAVLKPSGTVKLVGGFESLGEARFLEKQIEDALGIVSRPVAGEARGNERVTWDDMMAG